MLWDPMEKYKLTPLHSGKYCNRRHCVMFFLLFPENKETVCMKCQTTFSGEK